MTNYLNRVRHVVETTGTGSSIELAAAADGGSFFAMTDHGADGATYNYMLTEGTDVEIHEGETWDEDTLTFTRGIPVASKVGGVVGTSKIDLSGSARLRVIETAGDMQKVLSAKFAQTFDAGEKTQLQDNLGASTVGKALFTAADAATARNSVHAVLAGHLYGLTLANGSDATNDINIAVGEAADSTGVVLQRLTGALVKRLDEGWAAGTNAGMRNSGAAIANSAYHIYAVSKAGGADVDVYAHTSATVATVITALQAESGGASYIYARRIGSIIRSGGTILAFTQDGDEFRLVAQTTTLSNGAWTTTATDTAVTVPTGIVVESFGQMQGASSSASNYFALYPKTAADFTVTSSNGQTFGVFTQFTGVGMFRVRTDVNGNIRRRSSDSSGTGSVNCYGWIDTRGRIAA